MEGRRRMKVVAAFALVALLILACGKQPVQAPVKLEILHPSEGAIISGTGRVVLRVDKPDVVKLIEIYVADKKVAELKSVPFEAVFRTEELPTGPTRLTVRLITKDKVTITSNINVYVDQPPQVRIVNPENGMVISSYLTIQATASDDKGIDRVEFYSSIDGATEVLIGRTSDLSSGGYFQIPWSPALSGNYTIKARAFDTRENLGESMISIVVDKRLPSVRIVSPQAGESIVRGRIIPIVVDAHDLLARMPDKEGVISFSNNNGIGNVEFFVGDEKVGEKQNEPYIISWNSRSASTGSHTIKVRVSDLAGNYSENSVRITLVPTDVSISLIEPPRGASVWGQVTIRATATSLSGIRIVNLYVDGVIAGTDSSAPYEFTLNTDSFGEGNRLLKVEAISNGGAVAFDQIMLTFRRPRLICGDFGITEATFTQSSNWDQEINKLFGTDWRVADWNDFVSYFNNGGNLRALLDGLRVFRGNSAWCRNSGSSSISGQFYFLERSEGTLSHGSLRASLDSGFVNLGSVPSSQKRILAYRSTPLTEKHVRIISPLNNEIVLSQKTVQLAFAPGFTPNRVYFYLNNELLATVTSAPFQYQFDPSGRAPGVYRLGILAEGTGVSYYDTVTVEIPSFSVRITSPSSGTHLSGATEVNVSVTDSRNILDKIELYVDNTKVAETSSGPYKFQINTLRFPEGTRTLRARYYAKTGDAFQHEIRVVFDNTKPTVRITSPTANSVINGTVTVSASVTDNIELSKAEFYVNATKLEEKAIGGANVGLNFTFDTRPYSPGNYELTVRAFDKVGNSEEEKITVRIDQLPVVEILSPTSGTSLSGTFTVHASISDDEGIASSDLLIGGVVVSTKPSPPYQYSYFIGDATNTRHTLTVRATDTVGNSNSSSIVVYFFKLFQDFERADWQAVFENYRWGTTDPGKTINVVSLQGPTGQTTNVLRLGRIADGKEIWFSFRVTLNRPARLTFDYKTSSQQGDEFEFYVNDERKNLLQSSGQSPWLNYATSMNAGPYEFKFRYVKDFLGTDYDDCAYIDNLKIIYND